jgi:transposase-like protein
MARETKQYTESFKRRVLADAETMRTKDVASKHEIHPSLIYSWRKKIGNGTGRRSSAPLMHEDSQVRMLKDKLREALFAQYKAETGIDLSN